MMTLHRVREIVRATLADFYGEYLEDFAPGVIVQTPEPREDAAGSALPGGGGPWRVACVLVDRWDMPPRSVAFREDASDAEVNAAILSLIAH
jgi:hypothetical protein